MIVLFWIAAVITLVAATAAAAVDLRMMDRRIVGRFRDLVEVLLPLVGLIVLVGFAWRSIVSAN